MSLLCPSCKIDLVMSDRQGVEIDYCPKCRGVWLDRGELDKIIERADVGPTGPAPQAQTSQLSPVNQGLFGNAPPQHPPPHQPAPQYRQGYRRDADDDDDDDDRRRGHHGYQRKRKNWLSDIFD